MIKSQDNSNEAILKYIVPHLVNLIVKPDSSQKEDTMVKAKMMEALIYCLKNVKEGYLAPEDYRFFQDYFCPVVIDKFFEISDNSSFLDEPLVQNTIIRHIGDIVTIGEQFKYLTQTSISDSFRELKESGKEITREKRAYLENILNDDSNYANDVVGKVFIFLNKSARHPMAVEFLKNLDQIYFGLGKATFEENLFPHLSEWILSANTNILYEFLKVIGTLPIKTSQIQDSLDCFSKIENG